MNLDTRDEVLAMSPQAILHYEVAKAWWPAYVSNPVLQELAGRWFAWKAKRITARFRATAAARDWLRANTPS